MEASKSRHKLPTPREASNFRVPIFLPVYRRFGKIQHLGHMYRQYEMIA